MNITLRSNASSEIRSAENSKFRASIIIVSYNAKQKLMTCLSSVLNSLPDDCELIVVDNASVEGNADLIAISFPKIALIRSPINLGFAGGCNLGVQQARGKYLIFLNPDTLVEHGWLESLIAPLEGDEHIGLVTPRILLMAAPDRINTCGCDIHLTGMALCRGMGRPQDSYPQVGEVSAVSGAAFAIRRELFNELGGFDEDMFLYMEDIDLSWRARLAGYSTLYTPECTVMHDYELRVTQFKIFWQERNRYLMLLKSFKWPTLAMLIPAFILAETITWSFVLLKDRHNIANKGRAYGWIISNWSTIRQKRKATQTLRVVSDRTLLKGTQFKIDFDQAAGGAVATLARFVFNPLFLALKGIYLALVWW